MRTLILTGPATEEQRGIAQALKTALTARGGTCLAVDALAMLGQHAPLSLTTALEQEALPTPRAFAFLAGGASFQQDRKRKSLVYEVNAFYADHLRTLLSEGEFDAVLCLHRYPAEAIAALRKTLTFAARCCFISADFARVPFLEETALNVYFTPHEDLTEPYMRSGLPKNRIVPAGIPLPAMWFREEERADARALLNLPQDVPCYLVQSAPDPATAVIAMLEHVKGADARICAVSPEVVAPRNPFSARFAGEIRVVALSPDDEIPLYRAACDLLLCPPSGALSASAAVSGIPLVHLPSRTALEEQTARFFSARGMSMESVTLREAAELACALAGDAAAREKMRDAQRGVCAPDAAERIVRYLHEGKMA
jgi:processive 1,2-diacylglycerol beta-glucosyltransferase